MDNDNYLLVGGTREFVMEKAVIEMYFVNKTVTYNAQYQSLGVGPSSQFPADYAAQVSLLGNDVADVVYVYTIDESGFDYQGQWLSFDDQTAKNAGYYYIKAYISGEIGGLQQLLRLGRKRHSHHKQS